jgi:K+-transporting ATPase ATPase C chain
MKKEIIPSLLLTIVCILFFSGVYPAIIWGIAQIVPNKGEGFTIKDSKGKYYYENIGQKFTDDKYFWSRPSSVNYNVSGPGYSGPGSGGTNKGPDNPDYLVTVQAAIDTFMVHNPGINKADIPSDMVTSSGSGLDPHISVEGAEIQVARIAKVRGLDKNKVEELVKAHIEGPMLGMGPERVNVLKLNIDLDNLTAK